MKTIIYLIRNFILFIVGENATVRALCDPSLRVFEDLSCLSDPHLYLRQIDRVEPFCAFELGE